jgi:RNA ligase (TIGR02306 family)
MYHKRVRTVKLRGYISQGLLAPLTIPLEVFVTDTIPVPAEGLNVTEALGITKYEEPIPVEMAGKLLPEEPGMLKYTDIENLKNHTTLFAPNETVIVREKIHGSNFRAAKLNGILFVGSHNRNLARDENNLYWRAAMKLELDSRLLEGEQVFAEVYGHGVQDLSYGKAQGDIGVIVFDLFREGQFVSDTELSGIASKRSWMMAPLIHAGEFSDFSIPKQSMIGPVGHIAEGVVIRPRDEEWSERLQGRKILKSISDEYLLRKDGTERH